MALHVLLLVIGICAFAGLVLVLLDGWLQARHPTANSTVSGSVQETLRPGPLPKTWSRHVGDLSEPEPTHEPAGATPAASRRAARLSNTVGSGGPYRTRPGGSLHGVHWDPYAADQSTAHRSRAARRKPRPHRPAPFGESSPFHFGHPSHYELLGVPATASSAEIERAYRRLAARCHPDKFHDDPPRREQANRQLKQLNAVMQVLRSPESRERYDATLWRTRLEA